MMEYLMLAPAGKFDTNDQHFLLSCGRPDTLEMSPRFYFKIGTQKCLCHINGRIDLTLLCMEISSVYSKLLKLV